MSRNTRVMSCRPEDVFDVLTDGWSYASEVAMEEASVSGPAKLVPGPVEDLLLHARNGETLRRLACLAEGRTRPPQG